MKGGKALLAPIDMDAHIQDTKLSTVELEFDGKIYDVAASLDVLDKVESLPEEEIESIKSIKKIIAWLVNDAIARKNLKNGEYEKAIPTEFFGLLIGKSNIGYYSKVIERVLDISAENESSELDEEGNEIVVTEEMTEEFGELPPKTKN